MITDRPVTEINDFLERLAAPERPPIDASRLLIVVAHPDDETAAIGGQIDRLEGVGIVVVTDGAPDDMYDAHAAGYQRRESYAEARRRELRTALAESGIAPDAVVGLDVMDQAVAHRLAETARRLAALFEARRTAIVVTHAYEGGHPDHDATAFAVHAAAALLDRRGRPAPGIVEVPLYHLDPAGSGMVLQQFVPTPDLDRPETTIRLDRASLARKRRMMEAFITQRPMLMRFTGEVERFRPARDIDFRDLPNDGVLWYEEMPWGLTGEVWREAVAAAERDLGLAR